MKFNVSELTHYISRATRVMTNIEKIISLVFEINGIPCEHIKTSQGTTRSCIEYKLKDIRPYHSITRKSIQSQLIAALNDDHVTITTSGNLVMVEMPVDNGTLFLGDVINDPAFAETNRLTVAIGQKVTGENVFADIEDLKHILIAGTTGSGKSVFMQSLLLSLLAQGDKVEICIIDPKRVEFSLYNLCQNVKVISEIPEAVQMLKALCDVMDRRYAAMESVGARDIERFNEISPYPMKHLVLMVDELGDLMTQAKREAEPLIIRLAQKARACGIHLVLATQYPKSDIVTGSIKQNMPTKVCFATATTTGSVVMLGKKGAESLQGKGDMYFQTERDMTPVRLQAPFVTDKDIAYAIKHNMPYMPQYRRVV